MSDWLFSARFLPRYVGRHRRGWTFELPDWWFGGGFLQIGGF